MEKITLGILITSAVGGAILGIKKTNAEIKTLKESSVDVNKKIAKMQEASLANFKKMSVTAAITGMGIKRLVEPAIEFESAMADVKKVVDFDTPQQFEQMQKDILGLTRSLPLAGEELAQIAASGGQLGVAKQDITTFTTTIAKMATAFDMSAEDSGDAMAKLANVYQIPIKEIGKLGDAINHLSNNSPAKASDIVSTLGRVGGVAKAFGLTSNQAASLANSFISLGKTPEIAATAINSMLTTMSVAEKAPAKVQKALEDLGLSASHLKANIAKDGEGAIVDLLKRVNSMPKDMQTGILVDIFGREFADDVAVLAGGIDNYQKSINMLNSTNKAGKLDYLGSMEKEFNARAATTENNIQLLKNSMKEIGVVLGNTLLPILNDVVFGLKGLVNIISDFAKNNPTLTSGLIQATLAFAGFRTALLGIKALSFGSALKKLINPESVGFLGTLKNKALSLFGVLKTNIPKVIAIAKVAFSVLRVGIVSISRALLMNPIGLAITAIAGGALLIYKFWSPIKSFFATVWGGVKNIFSSAFSAIGDSIKGFFGIFKGIGSFLIDGLIGGITEKITSVKDTVVNVASSIGGWFKSVLGINSPSKVFLGYGQNIAEGLTLGIINNADTPKQSVKKLGVDLSKTDFKNIQPLNATSNLSNLAGASGNNQSITINFNPTINAPNGNSNDIKQALNMSLTEFERLFNSMMQRRTREAF